MGICGSKPKTSDTQGDAEEGASRLSTVLTSSNSADNEKLEELQVVREPSYIEATLDQHGLSDLDAVQLRKSPIKRLSSSEALKIASRVQPQPQPSADAEVVEESKAPPATYLGKEVEWDAELCNSDPAAGFAKFLTVNRIRPVDLYKEFDKEKVDQISTGTFVTSLLELGMPLDEATRDEKIAQLIASVDKDEDGKVSYAEFSAVREDCKLTVRQSSSVKVASRSTTPIAGLTSSPTRPRKSSSKRTPKSLPRARKTPVAGEGAKATSQTLNPDTIPDRDSAVRSPTSPTAMVRDEQKQMETKKKKSVSKHNERQAFIKKQQQEKNERAKHPKKNLREVMSEARGTVATGSKRVHPYLDKDGVEAKVRRDSNPEENGDASPSISRGPSRSSSRKKPVVVRGESFHGTFIKSVDGRAEMSPTTLVRREQEIHDRNLRAAADLHQDRMAFLNPS